jgi:hypothetical protein
MRPVSKAKVNILFRKYCEPGSKCLKFDSFLALLKAMKLTGFIDKFKQPGMSD